MRDSQFLFKNARFDEINADLIRTYCSASSQRWLTTRYVRPSSSYRTMSMYFIQRACSPMTLVANFRTNILEAVQVAWDVRLFCDLCKLSSILMYHLKNFSLYVEQEISKTRKPSCGYSKSAETERIKLKPLWAGIGTMNALINTAVETRRYASRARPSDFLSGNAKSQEFNGATCRNDG